MKMSSEITQLSEALAAAQSEIENVAKTQENPFHRSKYADLGSILDACKPILAKHKISIIQLPCCDDTRVGLETMILHASGQWISSSVLLPIIRESVNKHGEVKVLASNEIVQGLGSMITYLRRYAYAGAVSLAQVDDDGNGNNKVQIDKATEEQMVLIKSRCLQPQVDVAVKVILERKNLSLNSLTKEQADSLLQYITKIETTSKPQLVEARSA